MKPLGRPRSRRGAPALLALLCCAAAVPLLVAAPALAGPGAGSRAGAGAAAAPIWQRVLHPNRRQYEALLARARLLAQDGGHRKLAEAASLLRRAIALSPRPLDADWTLGRVDRGLKNWPACVSALGALYHLDPRYAPGDTKYDRNMALDYALAGCQARAGDWEGAVHHLRRIASRGYTHDYRVYWRLGEAYMALGRLDDAIDVLTTARRLQPSLLPLVAVAVAYDRDGRFAEARNALAPVLAGDPRLERLRRAGDDITPAVDRFYYLGLASEVAGRYAWATLYFRLYLARAGKGAWVRRARAHLAQVEGRTLAAAAIRISGSASLHRDRVVRAVRARAGDLEGCLAGMDSALIEVRITSLVPPRGHPAGWAASSRHPGVRALVKYSHGATAAALEKAVQCVERAANKLALGHPAGAPGTYSVVAFPLVAPH